MEDVRAELMSGNRPTTGLNDRTDTVSRDATRLPLGNGHGRDAYLLGQRLGRADCFDRSFKRGLVHKHFAMRVINMHQQYVYLKDPASSVNSMFMDTQHSGTRLRDLLLERAIKFNDFAVKLGLPAPQNINNWWSRGVPKAKARQVCQILGIRQEWLEDGEEPRDVAHAARSIEPEAVMDGPIEVWDDDTPLPEDEVLVPFLKEVELAAGSGRMSVEVNTRRRLRFGKYSLKNQGVDPANARCVTIAGNSMEPVLRNGATVGVDVGNTRIVDGDLYAINHGGQLRVKQTYRLPGGGIRLRSFNRDEHPDEEYSLDDMTRHEIVVIGRVFWGAMFF